MRKLLFIFVIFAAYAHGQTLSSGLPAPPTILPSGDNTACAKDTSNFNAVITAAEASGLPIKLAPGNYFINSLATITGPISFQGAGPTTVINYCPTTGNAFTLAYHTSTFGNTYGASESVYSDFTLQMKSLVTPTSGYGFKISNDGSGYLSGLHLERVTFQNMWQPIYLGTGLIVNWIQNNTISNCVSGVGIEYNIPSPGGDEFIDNDNLSSGSTALACDLVHDQGDTTTYKSLKLNGGGHVVFSRVGTTGALRFVDPSFEGATINNATITNFQISSNVVTFTNSGTNGFPPGQVVTISGLSTGTYLNGQTLTVLSTGLGTTQFQAAFTHANVGSTADSGTATAIVCAIDVGASGANAPNFTIVGGGIGLYNYNVCNSSTVTAASDAPYVISPQTTLYPNTGFGVTPAITGRGAVTNYNTTTNFNTTTQQNGFVANGYNPLTGWAYQLNAPIPTASSSDFSQFIADGSVQGVGNTAAAGVALRSKVTGTQHDWAFLAGTSTINENLRIYDNGNAGSSGFGDITDWVHSSSTNAYMEQFSPIANVGTQSVSGCTLSAAVGGSAAGQFASGTTGTCTVTITPGTTAPHDFACIGSDTATHVVMTQSGTSNTTCIITGSTTSGDVVTWSVWAY